MKRSAAALLDASVWIAYLLTLLRAIRNFHPHSIYELAHFVGRNLKNAQDHLRLLEEHGLVRLTEGRGAGERRTKVPEVLFGEIALKIAS